MKHLFLNVSQEISQILLPKSDLNVLDLSHSSIPGLGFWSLVMPRQKQHKLGQKCEEHNEPRMSRQSSPSNKALL
jgi:hypothetical protein